MGALYRYRARAICSIYISVYRHLDSIDIHTFKHDQNHSELLHAGKVWMLLFPFVKLHVQLMPELSSLRFCHSSSDNTQYGHIPSLVATLWVQHSDTPGYSVWPVCIREGKWHMTEAPLLTLSIYALYTYTPKYIQAQSDCQQPSGLANSWSVDDKATYMYVITRLPRTQLINRPGMRLYM